MIIYVINVGLSFYNIRFQSIFIYMIVSLPYRSRIRNLSIHIGDTLSRICYVFN